MGQHWDRVEYAELVPLRPERDMPVARRPPTRVELLRGFARRHVLALVFFVAPSLAAIVFFGFVLAPRYETQTQFVVRSAGGPSTQLTQMLASVGGDEGNLVRAFVESRDAVSHLEATAQLRERLARPESDAFWRFPAIFGRADGEALYEHYLSFVEIAFNETTGISTLTVQAFRPEDSVALAQGLLAGSEELINRLNDEARADMLSAARDEIAFAQERAERARAAMTEYRVRTGIFDPTHSSATLARTIGDLSLERTRLEAELIEVMSQSPLNPQISGLRSRIAALEAQIASERAKIGESDDALAEHIAEFERLALEREFADRALASALASFEAARREAQSARLYVELVVAPREPDHPRRPRRLVSILLAMAAFFALHVIVSAFVTNLFEHRSR